jgi:hypothetical protein
MGGAGNGAIPRVTASNGRLATLPTTNRTIVTGGKQAQTSQAWRTVAATGQEVK